MMLSNVFNKLISSIAVLLGVIILVFYLFILLPNAEEIAAGQRTDESTRAAMRAEMGLDKSKWEQFCLYLADLTPIYISNSSNAKRYEGLSVQAGDWVAMLKKPYLRTSYLNKKKVSEILSEAFVGSFVLATSAMFIALILGICSGIIAAIFQGKAIDNFLLFISTLGISLPSFLVAVLLAWLLGYVWHNFTHLPMSGSLFQLNPQTGTRELAPINLVLPAFALGIRPYSIIMQLTRSSLIDTMQQDYIRTARAKGLHPIKVVWKHALKNALNPVITAASGWFASLLAGSFFVEYIFNWKGIGKVTIDALQQSDLPVVMGAVILIAFIFIVINIFVDILYTFLDPRVKMSGTK